MAPFVALEKGRETAWATRAVRLCLEARLKRPLCIGRFNNGMGSSSSSVFNHLCSILSSITGARVRWCSERGATNEVWRGFCAVKQPGFTWWSVNDGQIADASWGLLLHWPSQPQSLTSSLSRMRVLTAFWPLQSPASAAIKGFSLPTPRTLSVFHCIILATQRFKRSFYLPECTLTKVEGPACLQWTLLKRWINQRRHSLEMISFSEPPLSRVTKWPSGLPLWSWNIRLCSVSLISRAPTFRLRTAYLAADFHTNLNFLLSFGKEQRGKQKNV